MKNRTALALFAVVFAVTATLGPGRAQTAVEAQKPITVFFLRHAEAEASSQTNRDPALTALGAERAEALARLLSKAGVTHLFASQFVRTQSTLAPLASALGREVRVISAQSSEQQVTALRELPPGSVAVVAGHSNTTPALVRALGGEIRELEEHERYGAIFGHDEYDRLIVVTLPTGAGAATQAIELRYGK